MTEAKVPVGGATDARTLKAFKAETRALLKARGVKPQKAVSLVHRHRADVKRAWEANQPPCAATDQIVSEEAHGMHGRKDPMRRRAIRIPKGRRVATSRRVRELVAEGYSPLYAAKRAYHGRDPGRIRDERQGGHTPRGFVVATDTFLSGWGEAEGGKSYYAIAVDTENEGSTVMDNLKHRPEMKRIRWVRTLKQIRLGPHDHLSVADRTIAPRYFQPGAFAERDPGKITAHQRRALHPSQFALPKRRALPLSKTPRVKYQHKQVANAASRLAQMCKRGTATASECREGEERIERAEKKLGMGAYHKRHRRDPGRGKSAKFERCVKDVKRKGTAYNPWAVCMASMGPEEVFIHHRRHDPKKLRGRKQMSFHEWDREVGEVLDEYGPPPWRKGPPPTVRIAKQMWRAGLSPAEAAEIVWYGRY